MTVKQFLKSKSFKCILVLLVIALVCGGLLSICNDILSISAEDKAKAAIIKIYGVEMDYETIVIAESDAENNYGTIDSVYKFTDGNYLIKATGGDGYKSGTVTAWIVAEFSDGNFTGIKAVNMESYEKQTLMGQIDSGFYSVFSNNDNKVVEGKNFSVTGENDDIKNIASGATKSSRAIDNAVNASLYYIRNVLNK